MEVDIWVDDGTLHLPDDAAPPVERDIELGPGWFESSRMLRLGLCVFEGGFDPAGPTGPPDESEWR